jgi:hypothetical protein
VPIIVSTYKAFPINKPPLCRIFYDYINTEIHSNTKNQKYNSDLALREKSLGRHKLIFDDENGLTISTKAAFDAALFICISYIIGGT